jgi:hypothetical protein
VILIIQIFGLSLKSNNKNNNLKFTAMKSSISTILDSYVDDNSSCIIENGGNAAEYILANTEAQDQGWFWFLSDEEIETFESDLEARLKMIQEIKDYINTNYSYEVNLKR